MRLGAHVAMGIGRLLADGWNHFDGDVSVRMCAEWNKNKIQSMREYDGREARQKLFLSCSGL